MRPRAAAPRRTPADSLRRFRRRVETQHYDDDDGGTRRWNLRAFREADASASRAAGGSCSPTCPRIIFVRCPRAGVRPGTGSGRRAGSGSSSFAYVSSSSVRSRAHPVFFASDSILFRSADARDGFIIFSSCHSTSASSTQQSAFVSNKRGKTSNSAASMSILACAGTRRRPLSAAARGGAPETRSANHLWRVVRFPRRLLATTRPRDPRDGRFRFATWNVRNDARSTASTSIVASASGGPRVLANASLPPRW